MNYLVDILTPDKVVATGIEAKSIKVETIRGEINILPDHTHLITSLFTGLLNVYDASGKNHFFTVSKGICKVLGNKITILSSDSLVPRDVDSISLIEEKNSLLKTLEKTDLMSDERINSMHERLDYIEAALKLEKL